MDGQEGTGRRGRGQNKKKDGWNKAGTRTDSDGKSDGENVAQKERRENGAGADRELQN